MATQLSMIEGDEFIPFAALQTARLFEVSEMAAKASAISPEVRANEPIVRVGDRVRGSTIANAEIELRARMGDDPMLCMAMTVASACCRNAGVPGLRPVGSIGSHTGPRAATHQAMVDKHQTDLRKVVNEHAGLTGFSKSSDSVTALLQLPPHMLVSAFCAVIAQATVMTESVEDLIEELRKGVR